MSGLAIGRFHLSDGVCFERVKGKYALSPDTIRILRVRGDNPLSADAEIEVLVETTLEGFASVIAHLTPGGANGGFWEVTFRNLGGRLPGDGR